MLRDGCTKSYLNAMKAINMKRKTLLLISVLLIIGVSLTIGVYLCLRFQELVAKPSWLRLGAFMTYEQFFVWTGRNETEYMKWNITSLRDDSADLHLISHGVDVTEGDVVITSGEDNWTMNAVTREIVDSSDSNYVGKKCPFWIETDVTIGSTVDTLYGTSVVSKSESIRVFGQQRHCWVVEYYWTTASMKRWYDKSCGILLKVHVVLHRQDITIEITETAVLTNIDLTLASRIFHQNPL